LDRNQDNVFEVGDMFIRGMLFQGASTINIQLIHSEPHHHLIKL